VLLLLGVVAEFAALAYFEIGSWSDRLSLMFQVLAFYGLGVGVLAKSPVVANFAERMTAPQGGRFVSGNFGLFTFLFVTLGLGVSPHRPSAPSASLGCVGQVLIFLVIAPMSFAYVIFHLVVIMPVAYLSFFFASALVRSIADSSDAVVLKVADQTSTTTLRMQDVVRENQVTARSFIVGVSAAGFALVTKLTGLIFPGN
jgi:hypothetical protein